MPFPRYNPGVVEYWLSGAATEFIRGVIDSWGAGVGGGIGSGVITGATTAGDNLTTMQQILVAGVSAGGAMIFAGIHAVHLWHKEQTNRFPNPFPAPPGNTNNPITQKAP